MTSFNRRIGLHDPPPGGGQAEFDGEEGVLCRLSLRPGGEPPPPPDGCAWWWVKMAARVPRLSPQAPLAMCPIPQEADTLPGWVGLTIQPGCGAQSIWLAKKHSLREPTGGNLH